MSLRYIEANIQRVEQGMPNLERLARINNLSPLVDMGRTRWMPDKTVVTARQYRADYLSRTGLPVQSREWSKVPRDHHSTRHGNKPRI